jgi:hypothetical protein
MRKTALDIYDDFPQAMKNYLKHYGWNFNKKSCDYAVSMMKKKNTATNKLEKIEPYSKEQVDEMLKKYNITLDNNEGYNYVFVANMCKADYLKSSIVDEQHLCLFIKDFIDDPDASEETAFRRWYITMIGNGQMVDWDEMM